MIVLVNNYLLIYLVYYSDYMIHYNMHQLRMSHWMFQWETFMVMPTNFAEINLFVSKIFEYTNK